MHVVSFQFIPNTVLGPHSRSLSKLRKAVKCNFCTTRSAIFRGNTNTNGDRLHRTFSYKWRISWLSSTLRVISQFLSKSRGKIWSKLMVAGCYLGFVWGPSSTPCKCCELQRKQISMGILFSLGFEWRALLNLLWPVTGLLQQPSKESERHQHLTTSKADKTNFRIRKPWLAAGTVYGSALHLALLGLQLRLLSSISISI